VVKSLPVCRHRGSLFKLVLVNERKDRSAVPYSPTAVVDIFAPGGSSMNGMNLSGKPGMVQPMQMPPTLGQPPIPAIQPRFGTLQLTTAPAANFTMHLEIRTPS